MPPVAQPGYRRIASLGTIQSSMAPYKSTCRWLAGAVVAAIVSMVLTPDLDAFNGRVRLQDAWSLLFFSVAVVCWFGRRSALARGLLATVAISMICSDMLLATSRLWTALMNRMLEIPSLAGVRRLLDCDGGCGVVRAEFEAQVLGGLLLALLAIAVMLLSIRLRAAQIAVSTRESAHMKACTTPRRSKARRR